MRQIERVLLVTLCILSSAVLHAKPQETTPPTPAGSPPADQANSGSAPVEETPPAEELIEQIDPPLTRLDRAKFERDLDTKRLRSARVKMENMAAAYNREIEKHEALVKAFESETAKPYSDAKEALRLAQEQQSAAEKTLRQEKGRGKGIFSLFSNEEPDPKAISAAQEALAEAQKRFADAEKKVDELEGRFLVQGNKQSIAFAKLGEMKTKLEAELNQISTSLQGEVAVREENWGKIMDLENEIATRSVATKMSELGSELRDTALKHKVLELTYNQGLIGSYMRIKLEGLLRDREFCKAAAACAKDGTPPRVNLESLFSTSESERREAKSASRPNH
jgi:hypothetical protein